MTQLCTLAPVTGETVRSSKATAVGNECDRPRELVHMDVTKLGRIPDGGGWCPRPQALRDHNVLTLDS